MRISVILARLKERAKKMIGTHTIIDVMAKSLFPVVKEYYNLFSRYGTTTSWDNEPFYQWICLKGLAESLNRNVLVDRELNGKKVDLQVLEGETCQVAIEMKRYFSPGGTKEIPGFLSDIRSLYGHSNVPEKIFVITTIHETSNQEGNYEFLSGELKIPKERFVRKFIPLDNSLIFEIIGIGIE